MLLYINLLTGQPDSCMSSDKLRAKLRLAAHRLRLHQKKKIELSLRAHKSIAELLSCGRYEHARIQVEQVARDDFIAEAYDLLEGYCDLLLSRFTFYETEKSVNESLLECVATLIWAAPKASNDIPELEFIASALRSKYGSGFCEDVLRKGLGVSDRIRAWLDKPVPPQSVVERYLTEIASSYDVTYEPSKLTPGEDSNLFLWQRDAERAVAKAQMTSFRGFAATSLPETPDPPKITDSVVNAGSSVTTVTEDDLSERLRRLKGL
ncbi:unnamed protein product [Dicrocoelium dendriticum]|nr:unnamed protein product [Dicrocoelium dendriticum]